MSFYWQQALQNQDTGQNPNQIQNQGQNQNQQPGQWDYINLGGPPAQNYQWNPSTQQQQQQQQQQGYGNYGGQQNHQQNQYQQQNAQNGQNVNNDHQNSWNQQQQHQHQHQQHPHQNQQRVQQNPYVQDAQPVQHQHQQQRAQQQQPPQPPQPQRRQNQNQNQARIEHTPLLAQHHVQQVQNQAHPTPSAPPLSAPPVQPVQPVQPLQQKTPQLHAQQQEQLQQAPPTAAPVLTTTTTTAQAPQAPQAIPILPRHEPSTQQFASVPPTVAQTAPIPNPVIPTAHINPSKEPTPERISGPSLTNAPIAVAAQAQRKEEPLTLVPNNPQNFNASQVAAVKITPSSSEDDWEKADLEIQAAENESKKQQAVSAQLHSHETPKPDESRESSLGGSWSHEQEQEISERNSVDQNVGGAWEQEIVEPPPVAEIASVTLTVTSQNLDSQANVEIRQVTPDVKVNSTALNVSSPGEAQATSTPKDANTQKRGSTSSQRTIVLEETTVIEQKPAPPPPASSQKEKVEKEDGSGNNSDSTIASGQPAIERGNIRASYRNYKQQYSEILKRLNGYKTDKNRTDFRPSSKLANPLLVAAGVTGSSTTSLNARHDGRTSVPLQQSRSFVEESGRGTRVSRLEGGRPRSRQYDYIQHQSAMSSRDHRSLHPHLEQSYRSGRYSTVEVAYHSSHYATPYDARRPQSTHMMEHYSNGHEPQEDEEDVSGSESEEDDGTGESADELRQYNMNQQANHSKMGHGRSYIPPQHQTGPELYYLGVVHIDLETYSRILERQPPPQEYYALRPIEKAAFMFFAAVYKQQYKNVDAFHKRFNREFYKYVCAGDSDDVALYKICKSMQDQYVARQQQNYEASLKNVFSEDNSIDGQSEANHNLDDDHVDSFREPLLHTCPHAFMVFGVGGKTLSIQPDHSISVVYMDDVKTYLKDVPTLRIFDAAQTFKGPLIPNLSAPHTVRLYISKQIEFIKRSEVAQENPFDNDVVESLLVWQLLEMMVKQQGKVTGPDIAELLAKVANQPLNIEAPPQNSNITPALNQFTQFLLGGHVDEAIEGAIRNGLFADALVLTRRLYPNDLKKISDIEERFLQTRSVNNPVTTLVSVASGQAPPVLTNPPLDDHLSWRTHAAIILANLDREQSAMNTIYHLGRALAKRDYHCAADFCFLVACVLIGYNPFLPVQAAEGEEDVRRHISLVSSGLPDDDEALKCQYGFSVTDLHATEIFDYALRLKSTDSPLASSVEYQTARMKYAKLLASHGYTCDAYRYCVEIARSIWNHYSLFKQSDLLEMCDLAESLHFVASADPAEVVWIEQLRQMLAVQAAVPDLSSQDYVETQNVQYIPDDNVEGGQSTAENFSSAYAYDQEKTEDSYSNAQLEHNTPAPAEVSAPNNFSSEPLIEFEAQPVQQPPTQDVPSTPNYGGAQYPHEDDIWISSKHEPVVEVPAPIPPTMPETPTHFSQNHQPIQPTQQVTMSQPQQNQAPHQILGESNPPPTTSNIQPNGEEAKQNGNIDSTNNSSRGWLGAFRNTVSKAIPAPNQMILPDDKNKTIVWDKDQNRYVGDGIVEENTAPPPPTVQAAVPQAPVAPSGGGLRSARGAARYANAGLNKSTAGAISAPAGMVPPMPMPTTFGFMPAPIDDGESVDPFSGQANPTIQQSVPKPSDD